jgi:hypothetical protein
MPEHFLKNQLEDWGGFSKTSCVSMDPNDHMKKIACISNFSKSNRENRFYLKF